MDEKSSMLAFLCLGGSYMATFSTLLTHVFSDAW